MKKLIKKLSKKDICFLCKYFNCSTSKYYSKTRTSINLSNTDLKEIQEYFGTKLETEIENIFNMFIKDFYNDYNNIIKDKKAVTITLEKHTGKDPIFNWKA